MKTNKNSAACLLYNKHAYERAHMDHKHYWEWMRKRNPNRWQAQEKGEMDYDAKNMMHTVRLILSGEHILKHHEPLVRVQGEQLDFLRSILAGRHSYEYLMDFVNEKTAELGVLLKKSTLPQQPDRSKATDLLRELTHQWEHDHA